MGVEPPAGLGLPMRSSGRRTPPMAAGFGVRIGRQIVKAPIVKRPVAVLRHGALAEQLEVDVERPDRHSHIELALADVVSSAAHIGVVEPKRQPVRATEKRIAI